MNQVESVEVLRVAAGAEASASLALHVGAAAVQETDPQQQDLRSLTQYADRLQREYDRLKRENHVLATAIVEAAARTGVVPCATTAPGEKLAMLCTLLADQVEQRAVHAGTAFALAAGIDQMGAFVPRIVKAAPGNDYISHVAARWASLSLRLQRALLASRDFLGVDLPGSWARDVDAEYARALRAHLVAGTADNLDAAGRALAPLAYRLLDADPRDLPDARSVVRRLTGVQELAHT